MDRVRINVLLLSACQALLNSSTSLMITIGGLVGYALAPAKSLATLPVSTVLVGTALGAIPASLLMKRVGRRAGFMVGSVIAVAGALLAAYALEADRFWLFSFGTLVLGVANAFGQLYRFAAADAAPAEFRGKAISWVMAGGVVAGYLGPQIAKWTKDALPVMFLASYYAAAGLWALAFVLQAFLRIPKPREQDHTGHERPLGTIVAQPRFLVAMMAGMIGYGVMSLLMTATPLAMTAHHHPFDSAATVIQWHVVGMFLPSFITGHLIGRFGVLRIITAGIVINVVCVAVAFSGNGMWQFWTALVLLGVGWNFMFIGGSTLLTETYTPIERPKSQALNDFFVFGTVAVSSLSSGHLLYTFGWHAVLATALPMLGVVLLSVAWLVWTQSRQPQVA